MFSSSLVMLRHKAVEFHRIVEGGWMVLDQCQEGVGDSRA